MADRRPGGVAAAVVNEDQFPLLRDTALQHFGDKTVQQGDVLGLVESGNDHADDGQDAAGVGDRPLRQGRNFRRWIHHQLVQYWFTKRMTSSASSSVEPRSQAPRPTGERMPAAMK